MHAHTITRFCDSPHHTPLLRHFWVLSWHSSQKAGGASTLGTANTDKVPWPHNITRCLCSDLMGYHGVLANLLKDLSIPIPMLHFSNLLALICLYLYMFYYKYYVTESSRKINSHAASLSPWLLWHLGSTPPFAPCFLPALHKGCLGSAPASPLIWTLSQYLATSYSGLCLHLAKRGM